MKSVKSLSIVLLILVSVLLTALPAFAAGDGSITVSNPIDGQTYTAYKIFDVSYSADKEAYRYSISKNSEWYPVVSQYAGVQLTEHGDIAVVEKKTGFSAAAFVKLLSENRFGKTGNTLSKTAGAATVSATGLELGYYFVSSATGSLCNLTTTDPSAVIHDKNDTAFDKTDDKDAVQIGETVSYKITSKVPDTTGFLQYDYIISDTMSAGLSFSGALTTLTVNGETLNSSDYLFEPNGNSFTLTIYVMNLQRFIGKEILVEYTARVNEKAAGTISTNKASLTYSNDPTDSEQKVTTPEKEETVYSAKIVVNKYDANQPQKKLAGAEFVLKNAAKNAYYKFNTVDKTVEWVTDKNDADHLTTDSEGAAEFLGLKDGTYYLEEISAPKGYHPLTADVEVIVDGSAATATNLSALSVTANVANSTGGVLPQTGGIGTTVFYVLGAALVLGAAVVLIARKRSGSDA